MSRWDEGLVPKWLSIDRDGFVSIDVRHPDFIRSFKDKFKDFGDVKVIGSKMESTTGGWISADEPPKEHGRYWCFVEYISDLGRSSYQWNCSWNQCEGRWGDLAEEGGIVTHWQPLPKPPEVSDE